MKARFILLLVLLISAGSLVWFRLRQTRLPELGIQVTSDPFPLAVGQTKLHVLLDGLESDQYEQTQIRVSSHIEDGGALTVDGFMVSQVEDSFEVSMTYPRMGRWTIDIAVYLPGQQTPRQERYPVYVYPVAPHMTTLPDRRFRSLSELDALTKANPSQEYWIIIPQGSEELTMHRTGEEIVPDEILLQVSGRNTLIIQNNDVADHNIGPFFVRAGETIRQEFTRPATYQGTCSIRHTDEITITVEA